MQKVGHVLRCYVNYVEERYTVYYNTNKTNIFTLLPLSL